MMEKREQLPQGMEEKLAVLEQIAHAFRKEKICWAVGGSLLLYFKGITRTVHDIDLMVWEPDIEKARRLLLTMGTLCPPRPQGSYRTRHFLEFVLGGVEVDVMAGFVILKDDQAWDCSLQPEQISEYLPLGGEVIPLQELSLWKKYYTLMDRQAKVKLLEEHGV